MSSTSPSKVGQSTPGGLLGPSLPPSERPDGYRDECPCRPLLDRVGDRWSSEVIAALLEDPHRFGKLRRRLAPVSHKVLTQTLRSLERDGLVDRTVEDDAVVSVTYSLSDLGRELAGPLAVMRDWAGEHLGEVAAAQKRYDGSERSASVTMLRLREHAA